MKALAATYSSLDCHIRRAAVIDELMNNANRGIFTKDAGDWS